MSKGKRYRPPTVGSLAERSMHIELWCNDFACLYNVSVSARIVAAEIGPKAPVAEAAKGYRCPRCGNRSTVAIAGPPTLAEMFGSAG